jgi:hypothetical protein
MKKILKSKWFRIPYFTVIYTLALYGAFLLLTYFAMLFNWTREAGKVDSNNRYFASMHEKYNQNFQVDSVSVVKHRYEILERILLLNDYHPVNAQYIFQTYQKTQDEKIALQMLDAVDMRLQKNKSYQKKKRERENAARKDASKTTGLSIFEWMNINEWKYFKEAVTKDKRYIDSAAAACGVEARIIVSCLVGEQVRLFNSRREKFKGFIQPLKTLALETNMSYGVTGIKESTAMKIERYLKDPTSPYYLGADHEHLLNYDSVTNYKNGLNDTMSVRLQRLVQFKNHYYSYLYAGIFVKQIKTQWENAGYPIADRPEILASLFNLGYQKSQPKRNPGVGGSVFKVNDAEYTFGSVAFEFYFSGELAKEFPYTKERFKQPFSSRTAL